MNPKSSILYSHTVCEGGEGEGDEDVREKVMRM